MSRNDKHWVRIDAGESLGEFPRIVSSGNAPVRERLGRIGGIWYYGHMDEVARNASDRLVCKWDKIDAEVEKLLLQADDLVMLFGYMPAAIVDAPRRTSFGLSIGLNAAPPADYADWEEICYQAVRHFNVERELGIRYWEVWNEPNGTGFWPGTFAEYLHLYSAAVRGAKRADSTVKVGGPVVTVGGPRSLQRPPVGSPPIRPHEESQLPLDWKADAMPAFTNYSSDSPYELIAAFIDHCARNDLSLDFLVWHNYNDAPGLDVYDLASFEANARLFRSWLDRHPQFREAEMIVDEWGVLNPKDLLADTIFSCAAALEMAKCGVLATFPFRVKPETANALNLFSLLGPQRLKEEASSGLTVLAASWPTKEIDILIVRMDKSESAPLAQVTIEIDNLTLNKHLRWERYLLDSTHQEMLTQHPATLDPVEKGVLPASSKLQLEMTLTPLSLTRVRIW